MAKLFSSTKDKSILMLILCYFFKFLVAAVRCHDYNTEIFILCKNLEKYFGKGME